MPALWEVAREAIRLLPGKIGEESLGRVITPSSFTTTTVVSTSGLAFGGFSEQAYAQKFIWRPAPATTADCIRYSDSFTPSTGTVTHSGTNYSDTTVGTESVILTPFYPGTWRDCIDMAARKTMETDVTIVPVIRGVREQYLHDLTWLTTPAQIRNIWWDHCPVITRNRYFQKRHTVNTSGIFEPDHWTVTSNADTTPYEATNYRDQQYRYSLERSGGVDATISQAVSALRNGVSGDYPAGETITGVVVADPDTAGDVLLSLADGTTTDTDSGSGAALQEITTSLTLASAATDITLTTTAQTSNAAQKLYESYACIGALTDSIRRDDYERYPLFDFRFEQGGPLKVRNPYVGTPGRLIIESERPFPGFDATRLQSGAADTDSTDCDITTLATGTIFYLFRGVYGEKDERTMEWERKFDSLRVSKVAAKTEIGGGFKMLGGPIAGSPRMVR